MITSISYINNLNSNISFKLYRHNIYDQAGNVINRADTCILRNDLDFDALIYYFDDKYVRCNKVNIIDHACSVGQETISLLLMILNYSKNPKKYLPINAYDKELNYLEFAKNGIFKLESFEKAAIEFYLKENFEKYVTKIDSKIFNVYYKLKDNLMKNIIFNQSDIIKDVDKFDYKNTALFLRNCWPYFSENDAIYVAKTLSEKMDKTSTLIIGDYDKSSGIDFLLKDYGFSRTHLDNVYEKQ